MARGFRWIDGELYGFEDNGTLIHDSFRDIDGRRYHFNGNWADRGWQELEEDGEKSWYYFEKGHPANGYQVGDGAAKTGYVRGIEGDGHCYFFWTDGYTDQDGKAHPTGALAYGRSATDTWVLQDGCAVYVADASGHLYVNTEKSLNGVTYQIGGDGKATPNLNYWDDLTPYFIKQGVGNNHCSAASIAIVTGYRTGNGDVEGIKNAILNHAWGSDGIRWDNLKTIDGCTFDYTHIISTHYCRNLSENGTFCLALADLLQNGPVVISNGQHYSVLAGYRGTDLSAPNERDFLVYDVFDGQMHTLEDFLRYGGSPTNHPTGSRSSQINICFPAEYRFDTNKYGIAL